MASASFWEGHAQVSVTGSPLVFQPAGRSLFVAIGRNKVSPLVYSAGTAIAGGLRWCDGSSVDARHVVCRAVWLMPLFTAGRSGNHFVVFSRALSMAFCCKYKVVSGWLTEESLAVVPGHFVVVGGLGLRRVRHAPRMFLQRSNPNAIDLVGASQPRTNKK